MRERPSSGLTPGSTHGSTLLALVDESASSTHYRIGALVIGVGKGAMLDLALETIMQRAYVSYGIEPSTELHGQEMFQGHGAWRDVEPHQRVALYARSLDEVSRLRPAIFIRSVDRREFRAANPRGDEHVSVMAHLLEDLQSYAERRGEYLDVLADDCRSAAPVRELLRDVETGGAAQTYDRIMGVRFLDSKRYRVIQAIDMVMYLRHRVLSKVNPSRREQRTNGRLWSKVDQFVTEGDSPVPGSTTASTDEQ